MNNAHGEMPAERDAVDGVQLGHRAERRTWVAPQVIVGEVREYTSKASSTADHTYAPQYGPAS